MGNLPSHFSILIASARMRLMTLSRYPGQLLLDVVTPIIFAALPILIGRASAGAQAGVVFAQHTGTPDYEIYMLIGSSVFTVVSFAFWHIAYWLRWEQESGTLEALYLAPTHRVWVAAGTALYSCIRSLFSASAAFLIGSFILGVDPTQGHLAVALIFILVGMVPLYGLTLLFGALILKVKEANSLVGLMQWAVSFLMGVFFPLAIFPPALRVIALMFPPTWMINGVRSALLDVGYFFGRWYLDLAVLWGFLLLAPYVGFWVFSRMEDNLRSNEGLGQY
jgi:ABC-2 type transport system permease protein